VSGIEWEKNCLEYGQTACFCGNSLKGRVN